MNSHDKIRKAFDKNLGKRLNIIITEADALEMLEAAGFEYVLTFSFGTNPLRLLRVTKIG